MKTCLAVVTPKCKLRQLQKILVLSVITVPKQTKFWGSIQGQVRNYKYIKEKWDMQQLKAPKWCIFQYYSHWQTPTTKRCCFCIFRVPTGRWEEWQLLRLYLSVNILNMAKPWHKSLIWGRHHSLFCTHNAAMLPAAISLLKSWHTDVTLAPNRAD